jgi:hypothetical protein
MSKIIIIKNVGRSRLIQFLYFLIIISFLLSGCKNNASSKNEDNAENPFKNMDNTAETHSFFPVSNFIKGQVFDISNAGINPIMYLSKNSVVDSVWLKQNEIEKAFEEYFSPFIDSSEYAVFFSEKKFLDESIGAITLSYDSNGNTPDSINWKHWDIYIDPETNQIKRIYLVKKINNYKTRQLTWIPGMSCRAITINEDIVNHKSTVEDEKIIKWNYKKQHD